MGPGEFVLLVLIIAVIFGVASAGVARSRGLSPAAAYFVAGFFLGAIGLIIAAVVRPPPAPPQPPGWYPDPWRQAWFRWWDGTNWSWHTTNDKSTA